MKRRVRWYAVEGNGLAALGRQMLKLEYSDELGHGFLIERHSGARTTGAYIEKFKVDEVVHGPHGQVEKYARIHYVSTAFNLLPSKHRLELIDPPRSARSLLLELSQISAQSLVISPIQPKVDLWLREFERQVGPVSVRIMSYVDWALTGTSKADITFSGSNDVRKEAKKTLAGGKAQLAAVRIAWGSEGHPLSCELSRSGATYPAEVEDLIAKPLRSALEATLE